MKNFNILFRSILENHKFNTININVTNLKITPYNF